MHDVSAGLVFMLGLGLVASCATAPASAEAPVSALRGQATITDAHCGGAMLTRAEKASLSRPAKALAFVVLRGNRNTSATPVARFVTGKDGRFELPNLPAGTYCVVRASRQLSKQQEKRILALPPSSSPPVARGKTIVDEACIARLPLRCDAVWNVGEPSFRPDIYLTGRTCPWSRPCTSYHGPLPP